MRFTVRPAASTVEVTFDDGGMNLLSRAALEELRDVVARFPSYPVGEQSSSPASQQLFLFGSGRPNLFAAGADMAEMRHFSPLEAMEFAHFGQTVFSAIERLPMLTVAWIDGDCFGGALDLALAFDVRLATARSRFSHPGARLGIVTGFGGTSRWRGLLDRAAAHRLFLDNAVISAQEAHSIALVDAVTEDPAAEIARFRRLNPARTQFVKELTRWGPRLTQSELTLLAERLGQIYFP